MILLLPLLLLLSAFFSSQEAAVFSIPSYRLRHLASTTELGKILSALMEKGHRLLATILFGNTLVNIGISFLSAALIHRFLVHLLPSWLLFWLEVGGVTLVILIFGEQVPKVYALNNAERLALKRVRLLKFFYFLFYPLAGVFEVIEWGITKVVKPPKLPVEREFRAMLELGKEVGALGMFEEKVLRTLFMLKEVEVREVMVPRYRVFLLSADVAISSVLEDLKNSPYSRVLLFKGKEDNIVGVLHIKDVLVQYYTSPDTPLGELARGPYFVPETMKLGALLAQFKERQIHLAIVVDEYGDFQGIVTLEDVLRDIVGKVGTEEEHRIICNALGEWVVDGELPLEDFKKLVGWEFGFPDGCHTVGGLVYALLEAVPRGGEVFRHRGYEFRVEDVHERRVKRLRIRKLRSGL